MRGTDTEALVELFRSEELALVGRALTSESDIRGLLAVPGLDLHARTAVLVDDAGRLGGFVALHRAPQEGQLRAELVVAPRPEPENTAARLLGVLDDWFDHDATGAGVPVTVYQFPATPIAPLLADHRWSVVHSNTRLSADLTIWKEAPASDASRGVRVRVASARRDRQALYAVLSEANVAYWDQGVPGFDAFEEDQRAKEGEYPGVWLLAEIDRVPAGALVARTPPGRAWIAWLGVSSTARRRGLAAALLAKAFGLLIEAGHVTVEVDTDTDNETAIATYESTGMSVVGRADRWQRNRP